MIKYIKSVLCREAKRLSYIEDARCLKVKATNTHSEYVILTAFPSAKWLHERVSMLRHSYGLFCCAFLRKKAAFNFYLDYGGTSFHQNVDIFIIIMSLQRGNGNLKIIGSLKKSALIFALGPRQIKETTKQGLKFSFHLSLNEQLIS